MSDTHILFVCTGNSCRSVMAEGLMQRAVEQAGVASISVVSAGVFPTEGMSPTRETQRLLQQIGVDCTHHRAQGLTAQMVEDADLVLVMEQFHLEEIFRRFPSARGKTHFLKSYGLPEERESNPNIPDPIGKPLEVYEVCFEVIREGVERVAKSLGLRPA